jgi:hypothetical protein
MSAEMQRLPAIKVSNGSGSLCLAQLRAHWRVKAQIGRQIQHAEVEIDHQNSPIVRTRRARVLSQRSTYRSITSAGSPQQAPSWPLGAAVRRNIVVRIASSILSFGTVANRAPSQFVLGIPSNQRIHRAFPRDGSCSVAHKVRRECDQLHPLACVIYDGEAAAD